MKNKLQILTFLATFALGIVVYSDKTMFFRQKEVLGEIITVLG